MPQFILQSSFQFGEVSELLHAQVQSPIYYKAARRLRNVMVIPTGGARKRFGTTYINTISGITDYTLVKPFFFTYADGRIYFLLFRNLAIDIYFEGAIVATVTTTYTSAEIKDLDLAQSTDALFITHGSHIPAILTRVTHPSTWSLDDSPTFLNYPTFDFEQNYNAITFLVLYNLVDPITTAQNYLGFEVILQASSAVFTADHVGGLFFGDSGTLRITAFTDSTNVTANIIQPFDNLSALFHSPNTISGSVAVLTEVAFSATRGYPQKVSFYQNRIWFARTASLLGALWGSNYNGYTATTLNFDDSDDLATNAISTILSGSKPVIIESIISYKTLVIMTTDGFFSTSLFSTEPITPTNVAFINKRTSDASNSVKPVVLNNNVIFFDKGGKKVKNISVTANGYDYKTSTITVLCPQLVDIPYSAAVYENSPSIDGSWLFMVNSGTEIGGSLSIYQSVPEEEITAWTLSTTDGLFRHVASTNELVYFIVERTIGGSPKLFIEQLDFDLNTDATYSHTYMSPTSTITGLGYLEGETVTVIADGAPVPNATVASGSITLEDAATTVEVGLFFQPLIRPMPLNVPTNIGNSIYLPKSINIVYVDYNQSLGIEVNGIALDEYQFNVDQYNVPPTLKTNFSNFEPFGGWNPRQQVDISQSTPWPFTIIGVGYMVTV